MQLCIPVKAETWVSEQSLEPSGEKTLSFLYTVPPETPVLVESSSKRNCRFTEDIHSKMSIPECSFSIQECNFRCIRFTIFYNFFYLTNISSLLSFHAPVQLYDFSLILIGRFVSTNKMLRMLPEMVFRASVMSKQTNLRIYISFMSFKTLYSLDHHWSIVSSPARFKCQYTRCNCFREETF